MRYGCEQNIKQARHDLLKEEGTNHAQSVKLATKADIAWVEGMGGYVPEQKNEKKCTYEK